jgi:hypothetical protein
VNLEQKDATMMRPTVAVSGITEAKRREQGRIGESNIIAAHPDKWWLRELILSQLANADSGHYPTLGRVDLGLLQRQAKQTRSLPASLVLNLSQGRSCLTFPTIPPGYCCYLLPFDIRIFIVIVDLNLGLKLHVDTFHCQPHSVTSAFRSAPVSQLVATSYQSGPDISS